MNTPDYIRNKIYPKKSTVKENANKIFDINNKGNGQERYGYKDRSLMTKMGFQDEDLKTQTHDEIFLKLGNNDNLLKIISALGIDHLLSSGIEYGAEYEFPITNNNYIIGYVDAAIWFVIKDKTILERFKTYEAILVVIIIEIKTNIENIGELLRQIHTYKTYEQNICGKIKSVNRLRYGNIYPNYIVISPDIKPEFCDMLHNNKITCINTEFKSYICPICKKGSLIPPNPCTICEITIEDIKKDIF